MSLFKQLKAPCAKCPYKLGQVKTLVDPCPQCKANGYRMYELFTKPLPGETSDEKNDIAEELEATIVSRAH